MKKQAPPGYETVGYISGVKGLKGELRLQLFADEAVWAKKLKSVLLLSRDNPTHTIEKKVIVLRSEQKGFILSLEEITTRELAETLKSMQVAILASLLESESGETLFLRELLGYLVFDGDLRLGCIIDFQTNTAQDLLVVKCEQDQEILIPLIKNFILRIDHEKKELHMQLPEGLTKVNHAL